MVLSPDTFCTVIRELVPDYDLKRKLPDFQIAEWQERQGNSDNTFTPPPHLHS
jgi:hypothetical protein